MDQGLNDAFSLSYIWTWMLLMIPWGQISRIQEKYFKAWSLVMLFQNH